MDMRFLAFVGLVALLAAAPAYAKKDAESFDYLAKWEGHYPSMTREPLQSLPVGQRFWDDPNVLAMMKKNIPTDLMKRILLGWEGRGESVETPILKQGDVLFVSVCKPHECASNAARLYFNLDKKSVQVCWTETDPKTGRQQDVWVAKKTRRLGLNACLSHDKFEGLEAFGLAGY